MERLLLADDDQVYVARHDAVAVDLKPFVLYTIPKAFEQHLPVFVPEINASIQYTTEKLTKCSLS